MQIYQVLFINKRQSLGYDAFSELVVRLCVSQIICVNPFRIGVCVLIIDVLHRKTLQQKSFEFETIWKWRINGPSSTVVRPENHRDWAESEILYLIRKKTRRTILLL